MASMYGQPPAGMAVPHGQPMAHMPVPHNMGPPGQMPPQMHPNMRPGMQHPGHGGQMMPPGVTMGHNGMGIPNMGHMQQGPHPHGYGNNQQMSQFAQQMPQMINTPEQQAMMRQRMMLAQQQQQQQRQNPQMMMGGVNPGGQPFQMPPQAAMQQKMGAGGNGGQHNPALQAAMQQQQQQRQHNPMNPHVQQNHPQGMQRQQSVQGQREHPTSIAPQQQHPGQQGGPSMPPHTPQQNPQLQRPRPPPPNSQAPAQPQQHTPQHQQQPQPPQQPPEGPPQNQPTRQPTPQSSNAPPSNTQANTNQQQRVQQGQQGPNQPQQQPSQGPQQSRMNQQQMQENEHQRGSLANRMAVMNRRQMFAANAANQNAMNETQVKTRLDSFCQVVNETSASQSRDNIDHWQRIVDEFFTPQGTFRTELFPFREGGQPKEFEISAATLARYFIEIFGCGVSSLQISTGGNRSDDQLDHITSSDIPSTFSYYLDNGGQVVASGVLRLGFDGTARRFDSFEFCNVTHEEFVSRRYLETLAQQDQKHSPEKSKTSNKKAQGKAPSRIVSLDSLYSGQCGEYGIFPGLQQFMEHADVLSRMRPLFDFHHRNPRIRAGDVLEQFLAQPIPRPQSQERSMMQNMQQNFSNPQPPPNPYANFQQQPGMQQQPNGAMRTPGVNGFPNNVNYFQSPANAHLNLPNHASPHLAGHSPPPGQQQMMQSQAMMAQGSHQGINQSAIGSSNASPNVTGKRRRQSVAKPDNGEGSEGMGPPPPQQGGNSKKVKQSPRPGGKKQQSGNQ